MDMREFLKRHHRAIFYSLWFLAGLLHAGYSGLLDDEAYYRVYGRFPAWGYFDHPPMVGVLTRAGDVLFDGSLGVRFLFVLLSTATVLGIDSLVTKRDDRLFYAIVLGIGLLQFGGVIAVPDVPLMFFTVLFFLSYRQFIRHPGTWQILLLGLATAGMFYSKYHGVLVVFFTLLSHPRLLLRWETYVAGLVALLLFMPHLYWQFTHDFPSFRYHLFERNAARYKTEYTVEYLLGQLALAGPLIGWLLIWAAFRAKPGDLTEKALKYCLMGVYAFFLLSTFKGRVEANWTAPAFIPLVVLSHRFLSDRPWASKWVFRLLVPSLLIVLSLRVYMMLDIDPVPGVPKDEFHRNREWADTVRNRAAGLPAVFVNSYQRASQYMFQTDGVAFALNDVYYRRNNYNFWPLETPLLGRKVLVLSAEDTVRFREAVKSPRPTLWAMTVDPYFSFSQVDVRMSRNPIVEQGRLKGMLDVRFPEGLRSSPMYRRFDTAAIVAVLYDRSPRESVLMETGLSLRDAEKGRVSIDLPMPDSEGRVFRKVKWGIRSAVPGHPSLNSTEFSIDRR